MPNITIKTGPAKGTVFQLVEQPQSIGREADIQILDTAASRKHAEVFVLGDSFFVRDLDSRNGTYVNDLKIDSETELRPGDHIRIGSSLLVFGEQADAEQAVEFVQDEELGSSTVEIQLGERAAQVVSGDKVRHESLMGRLFTMYEVSQVLGSEVTVQGILDKVLDIAMASVKPSYCYLFDRDERTGNLVPRAWRDPLKLKRRKISRSIVNRAMQRRHSILTADAASDRRFNQSESVVIGEVRSVICCPLISRGHINGLVYLGRDASAKPFTGADLALATGIAFQTGIALENVAAHGERRTEAMAMIKALVGLMELRQPELRGHSERVAAYAAAISERLGLSPEESEDVLFAVLLHDIGKINVSEVTRQAVSAVVGHSVQEQYCHAVLGAKALAETPILANAIPGVRYHHERIDGFGGPEGLSGEDVPLIARIVGTANRFDHLTTDPRAGSPPLTQLQALESIEQPGEGLDDTITRALVEVVTTGTGVTLPKLVLQEFC